MLGKESSMGIFFKLYDCLKVLSAHLKLIQNNTESKQ